MTTGKTKTKTKAETCSVRLNAAKRCKLNNYAKEIIDAPAERLVEARAHADVMTFVRQIIAALTTPAEYAILRKFGALCHIKGLSVRRPREENDKRPGDSIIRFSFVPPGTPKGADEQQFELEVPQGCVGNWGDELRIDNVEHEKHMTVLVTQWNEARKAHEAVRAPALKAIHNLIYNKRTLLQVAKVWPPAMDIAEELGVKPTSRFTDQDAATIKALKGVKIEKVKRKDPEVIARLSKVC
jgi:hypothetical protein